MPRLIAIAVMAVSGLFQTAHSQQATLRQPPGVWRDPATDLIWADADNGFGVSAAQASYSCAALNVGGHKDWRLPGIEELQTLYGGPADENGHHVIGPIRISGWAWSSNPGLQPGEQWALDFGDGGRASAVTGDSGLNRALCVRSPAPAAKQEKDKTKR